MFDILIIEKTVCNRLRRKCSGIVAVCLIVMRVLSLNIGKSCCLEAMKIEEVCFKFEHDGKGQEDPMKAKNISYQLVQEHGGFNQGSRRSRSTQFQEF
jgi:hypothetical protein